MKILNGLLILLLLTSPALGGANDNETKYITVIPGKQYKAGWLHKLFLGAHWRHLWTTPIRVEVLDLGRFAGGLTPVKRGGGRQTKSLHFKGNDGNSWKFRSVDKDPRALLTKEFQDTLVESALRDQISSANPMAALILPPILKAVGILQAEPQLVWMPDDERLGQYREEFGRMLGTIELHPRAEEDDSPGFEDAKKVINTYKLLNRLEKERDEQVDAREFLKARLVDIFVGDWDRHSDQWRWALYKEGGQKHWKPIPRDRDQAFSKFDGFFPWLGTYLVMDVAGFGKRYPWVRKITWSGRHLDRRFLCEMDKPTWDAVTKSVKDRLTHQVIREAVKRLPPEDYKKAGKKLIKTLTARRDRLAKISLKYFKQINKVVDVFTGAKDDFVEINRINDDKTAVTVFKRDKKTGEKKGKPIYHKIVEHRFTSEIRIYLSAGDDRAEVKGIVNSSPLVRVIGGEGKDQLIDRSKVKGFFLKITPFRKAETRTIFYDSGKKTLFKPGPGTKIVRDKVPKPADDKEKYEPLQRNRYNQWLVIPIISFNSDDGMVMGASTMVNKFNFRVKPYDYSLSLSARYATKTKSYDAHFRGIFYSIIKGAGIHLEIIKTKLLFNDYFGFGNDTGFDSKLEKEKYYETEEEFLFLHPSVHFNLFKNTKAAVGLVYTAAEIALANDSLLEGFPRSNYGLGKFQLFELESALQFDTRDKQANPHKGFFLRLAYSYAPKLFDNRFNFTKAQIDTRFFFRVKIITPMTAALRLGGSKTWGDYPFFKAAFLGGGDNLRGYSKKRFSGDAALFGQLEVRAYLGPLKLILPGRIGFHLFSEAGRVFIEGENSEKWHPAYGGGLWMSFANRLLNTSLTI
ncbi:BamA/TamA family outer membrane protein, partial [Acidobacteriota bacterium]